MKSSSLRRAIWAVQDKIALDAEEEKAIELKRELVGGQERVVWNPSLSIPAKELDFTDAEAAPIKVALQTWDLYGAATLAELRRLIGVKSYEVRPGRRMTL